MKMTLGQRDVVCVRKNGMKNKVCGLKGYLHENEAGSMGCGMRWFRPMAKPYFSSHKRSLCHIPLIHMQAWSNLIFHASVFWAHKPYFSYHVLLTQFRSHSMSFGPINLIFHTIFLNACHVPLTQRHFHANVLWAHKPFFSYHVPLTQFRSHTSTLWTHKY